MGPLVPYIFSNELNLAIALIIGFAFGFILEQAGFSTTKKLVGLFYGYDFTVLRVFFTAGVTAMIGVVILSNYGLLDMDIIYVNPTFVRSAIIGGAIMGAGFIIGGFCPGTSICAAAIGKIDAIIFILGACLGVFIFIEIYPNIIEFYHADNLGNITFFNQLGISKITFAFLLTIIALLAFYFTWRIENKVNGKTNYINPILKKKYAAAIITPVIILLLIIIIPDKQTIIYHKIAKIKEQKKCVFYSISADKLAYEITNNYYKLNIIDVRSPEEFKKSHLPLSINIPFEDILNREWENVFKQKIKTNIFYANSDTFVKMSCLKAKFAGNSENLILEETADNFMKMFFNIEPPQPNSSKSLFENYHFRSQSAKKMNDLVKSFQNNKKPLKKKISKVKGGCS